MTARKHPQLKLLCGTARHDRVSPVKPTLPALDAVPSPPTWITNLDAVKEWHRLAPVLTVNKLLTPGNIGLFAQYVSLHGRMIQIWSADGTPTAALISSLRALAVALGLTAINPPTATAKPNRFSEIARRRR